LYLFYFYKRARIVGGSSNDCYVTKPVFNKLDVYELLIGVLYMNKLRVRVLL